MAPNFKRKSRTIARWPAFVFATAALLNCLALPYTSCAAAAHAKGPTLLEVNQRLHDAPYSNTEREALLRRWFKASGCRVLTEQVVSDGHPPNIICLLKGKSSSLVVVGGHSDHVKRGMGVVDDWSGASMLPSLFQDLNVRPRNHSFMFIGFTEEEKGLVGSAFFVRHLSETQKDRIRAMVNLECLGLAPPEVWSDHADPRLLSGLFYVARRLGIPVRGIDLENIGRDDAESFRKAAIPTITIHSLTQSTIHIMHSPQDEFSAVDISDYDEAYRLVAAYLAYLDSALH
jgi:Iap family predicted aminopeptidase